MKKNCLLLLVFLICSNLFSQNAITLRNEAEYCVVTSNEISLLYYSLGEGENEINCRNEIQSEY